MNGSESLQNDQSAATENALRRAVDITPAFIHTARPDGYLDYFNRGWLDGVEGDFAIRLWTVEIAFGARAGLVG